jgi:hypothetical protein
MQQALPEVLQECIRRMKSSGTYRASLLTVVAEPSPAGLATPASSTALQPLPEVLQECIRRMKSSGTYRAWRLPAIDSSQPQGSAREVAEQQDEAGSSFSEASTAAGQEQACGTAAAAGTAGAGSAVDLQLCSSWESYMSSITMQLPAELRPLLPTQSNDSSSSSSKGVAFSFYVCGRNVDSCIQSLLQQLGADTLTAAAAAAACQAPHSSSSSALDKDGEIEQLQPPQLQQQQQQQQVALHKWDHSAVVDLVCILLTVFNNEAAIACMLQQHLAHHLDGALPENAQVAEHHQGTLSSCTQCIAYASDGIGCDATAHIAAYLLLPMQNHFSRACHL